MFHNSFISIFLLNRLMCVHAQNYKTKRKLFSEVGVSSLLYAIKVCLFSCRVIFDINLFSTRYENCDHHRDKKNVLLLQVMMTTRISDCIQT